MRLTIDTEARVLTEETSEGPRDLPLYSPEAFSLLESPLGARRLVAEVLVRLRVARPAGDPAAG